MAYPYGPYSPYNPYQQIFYPPQYGNTVPQNVGQPQNAGASQPQQQQPVQPQPIQQTQPIIFVPIPSEQDARSYPVAPGNSVTFKDEFKPYCYVKTMGLNQFDRPVFEKYRLVKEEDSPEQSGASSKPERVEPEYASKSELAKVWGELKRIEDRMDASAERKPPRKRLMEDESDEE